MHISAAFPPCRVVIVFRYFVKPELFIVMGSDPFDSIDGPLLQRRIDVAGCDLYRQHTESADDLPGEAADPEFQAPHVLDLVDLFSKPAPHLAAGISHWDAIAIEPCEYFLH